MQGRKKISVSGQGFNDQAVRTAIQKIAGTYQKSFADIFQAKVNSVDEDNRTCNVTQISGDGEVVISAVNLCSENNDGQVLVPEIDSTILVATYDKQDFFMVSASDLQKFFVAIENAFLLVKPGLVQLGDGLFGGLVKVQELVDKLNTIEQDINSLKNVFSAWTPVPNDGGAALKAAAAAWMADPITETEITDLENSDVKHGNNT